MSETAMSDVMERMARANLKAEKKAEGDFHPANRLSNVRRRNAKARWAATATVCVTCPASRHVAMMADAISTDGFYRMLTDEPLHCATGMYSVVTSLWEARAEIARLQALLETPSKEVK